MKGKAFFKKVESSKSMVWRGAKVESSADAAFVRISSKATGATYQLSGAAVQRITADELDALMQNRMPENRSGILRIMLSGDEVFPYAWSTATCLAVCVAKYSSFDEPVHDEPVEEASV